MVLMMLKKVSRIRRLMTKTDKPKLEKIRGIFTKTKAGSELIMQPSTIKMKTKVFK
jgi:hypothetical protein